MEKTSNLSKYIGNSGIISRRKAAEAVKDGRVSVNGVTICDPATPIAPGDEVLLDGRPVARPLVRRYWMLNKPPGVTTTHADRHAGKTVFDLLPGDTSGMTFAGRLDRESEGQLLLSDDGEFIQAVTHPSNCILKRYFVVTSIPLAAAELAALRRGVVDAGEKLKPEQVNEVPGGYEFVLNEGKKREIRRLVAAVSRARINTLRRIATGSVLLGDLPLGHYRELTDEEIASLK